MQNDETMKASEYQRLITGLDKLTEWSDTLRAVFSRVEIDIPEEDREPDGRTTKRVPSDEARGNEWFPHRFDLWQANENWAGEIARMMDSCLDGFVDENQVRADKGLAMTDPCRALFNAMSRFLNATVTPIDGAPRLYHDVRARCRDWYSRLLTWFPDIDPNQAGKQTRLATTDPTAIPGNPAFVRRLMNSDAYKKAIADGDITHPVTWNRTIKGLAIWLSESGLLDQQPKIDNVTEKTTKWKFADGVFIIAGKAVTATQLKNGSCR